MSPYVTFFQSVLNRPNLILDEGTNGLLGMVRLTGSSEEVQEAGLCALSHQFSHTELSTNQLVASPSEDHRLNVVPIEELFAMLVDPKVVSSHELRQHLSFLHLLNDRSLLGLPYLSEVTLKGPKNLDLAGLSSFLQTLRYAEFIESFKDLGEHEESHSQRTHTSDLSLQVASDSGLDLFLLSVVSDDGPPMQLEVFHFIVELIILLLLFLLLH